jgi:hypothetical protein
MENTMNGLWPSMFTSGLAAARPTNPNAPTNTALWYFATDTGVISNWNPSTSLWQEGDSTQAGAATGATQQGALAITSRKIFVTTATASSKGVLLPLAATGLEVIVCNKGPTFGVKVYPNTNDQINAGTTNAADTTVLAKLKVTRYLAADANNWATLRGA